MPLCSHCAQNLFTPRIDADLASIRERLRSESGPASVQPDEISAILLEARRDLEDYEKELHRLESRRIFVAAQQERLREFMSQTHSLLSPVRKIPDEVLRQVFDACCYTNQFEITNNPRVMEPLKPAMAVSSVCSRWRRVGLAFPSIWSRISLQYDARPDRDEPVQPFEHVSQILAEYISRSEQWPLTVTIRILGDYRQHKCHPLSLLVDEYPRWRCFTFHGGYWTIQNLFASADSWANLNTFPKLVQLQDFGGHVASCFAHRVPSLRCLILGYLHGISPAFPWAQLLHLELSRGPLSFWPTGELSKCTSLISLVISDLARGSTSAKTYSTIETLTVRNSVIALPEESTFPFLTCPSLKTLHLPNPGNNASFTSWHNFDLFMAFVKRSSFPLTTLSMESLPLSDSNVVYLLSHIQTLQEFILSDINISPQHSPITSQLVESLHSYRTSSLRRHTAPLVPRLRPLTLDFDGPSFKDEAIVDMVRSRWTPGHTGQEVDCLRSFTIIFRGRTEIPGAYDVLDHIGKDGMRVAILWKGGDEVN